MINKIFILMLAVFVVNAGLAMSTVESLPSHQQGVCINLPQSCGNCTYVNITSVTYPNSTVYYIHKNMEQSGSRYNWTFCDTHALGKYIVDGEADSTVWNYDFEVTQTGTVLTTGQSILYIVFLVAASLIFAFVLYGAVKLPFKDRRDEEGEIISINDLKYLKIFLICMSYVLFLFIVGLLRGILDKYAYEVGVQNFFNVIYWLLLSFMFPIIVLSLLLTLILFINGQKLKKAIERGLPIR